MEKDIKIADGFVFTQNYPECNKKVKCRMVSFKTPNGYHLNGYRFECPNGHIFEKNL